MSLREDEDRQKNCPSRGVGLGVAVAAIGVGVGAALYYFMNRRPENPNTAGSTTQDWTTEPERNLHETEDIQESESSFTTISENSTTDTSMNSSTGTCNCSSDSDSDLDVSDSDVSDSDVSDSSASDFSDSDSGSDVSASSGSVLSEWDVTDSIEFPSYMPVRRRDIFKDYAWNLVLVNYEKSFCCIQHIIEYAERTWEPIVKPLCSYHNTIVLSEKTWETCLNAVFNIARYHRDEIEILYIAYFLDWGSNTQLITEKF